MLNQREENHQQAKHKVAELMGNLDQVDKVAAIEARFGPFPRHLPQEVSVMKSFMERFGTDAPRIARYAFESPVTKGMWGNAPIRVTRFTRASDEWFAKPILKQLQRANV